MCLESMDIRLVNLSPTNSEEMLMREKININNQELHPSQIYVSLLQS